MPFTFISEDGEERIGENEKKVSKTRSVLSAPVKGLIKEGREQLFNLPILGEELRSQSKSNSPLVSSDEKFGGNLENLFPTRNEFTEKSLERGARILPYAAIGGGGVIQPALRSLAAGFLGEKVKESGGNDIAQSLSEIFALGFPSLQKKIIPKNIPQKEVIDFARRMGLSESQIAPMIQGEKKQSILSGVITKRGYPQKKLAESKKGLSNIYESLASSPDAQQSLNHLDIQAYLPKIHKHLMDMPMQERNRILPDFMDLVKTNFTGSGLINFYKDLNFHYGKGHKHLGTLLDPTKEAIGKISPQLKEDFSLTNRLAKQFKSLSQRLKPSVSSDLLSGIGKLGRMGRFIFGLATHHPFFIYETLGESVGKKLAQQMLLNPRFQNISMQIIKALNSGKFSVAKSIADKIKEEHEEERTKKVSFLEN